MESGQGPAGRRRSSSIQTTGRKPPPDALHLFCSLHGGFYRSLVGYGIFGVDGFLYTCTETALALPLVVPTCRVPDKFRDAKEIVRISPSWLTELFLILAWNLAAISCQQVPDRRLVSAKPLESFSGEFAAKAFGWHPGHEPELDAKASGGHRHHGGPAR